MKTTIITTLLLAPLIYFGGCSYRNVDVIKKNAAKTWDSSGFEIVGYEGYQIGYAFMCPGGKVWYIVQRKGDSTTRYHGFLSKWGDEYHIYSLRALDAITQ